MSTAEAKPTLPVTISWAYAVIAAIVATFILFLVTEVLQSVTPHAEAIGMTSYVVVVSLAVFLICRAHPGSVWFAPIVCNAGGILSACFETSFWHGPAWYFIVSGWMISIALAGMAARVGRREERSQDSAPDA